jgi:hypothetical protein
MVTWGAGPRIYRTWASATKSDTRRRRGAWPGCPLSGPWHDVGENRPARALPQSHRTSLKHPGL